MSRFIKHLLHRLSATNHHGVHSPFVYDYLTKGLYTKKKYSKQKRHNVLMKSLVYFSIEKFKIVSKGLSIENQIKKEFKITSTTEVPFDLIYLENPSADLITSHEEKIHNDSMFLIGNIHSKKEHTSIWFTLQQDELITVSIDMYYCGMLFVRQEQKKEHFKIRI